MKNLRRDFKKLVEMLPREFLIMRTRLPCCRKNWKDLMVLLKGRIMKSEHWEVKFKKLNKISDCPVPNRAN